MSITATRKVSSSASPVRRTEKNSKPSGHGESFVENIDTANNVLILDSNHENEHDKYEENEKDSNKEEAKKEFSSNQTYVTNAIEALSASGIYDIEDNTSNTLNSKKISVYDNNQSMIKNNNKDSYSDS